MVVAIFAGVAILIVLGLAVRDQTRLRAREKELEQDAPFEKARKWHEDHKDPPKTKRVSE